VWRLERPPTLGAHRSYAETGNVLAQCYCWNPFLYRLFSWTLSVPFKIHRTVLSGPTITTVYTTLIVLYLDNYSYKHRPSCETCLLCEMNCVVGAAGPCSVAYGLHVEIEKNSCCSRLLRRSLLNTPCLRSTLCKTVICA
jgi:hypothetical protein